MTMTVDRFTASGWSIDTRTLVKNDFFIALRGPNHDGHDHVATAFERGAIAALVDHPMPGPIAVVPDTQKGLEDLGHAARKKWGGKVVGVTGSAGKTSTKEIIAAMLAVKFRTAKNEGNLNNHIGVPLSILRLPETAEVAVLEMGMNHAGEIAHLCGIAAPNVGVVTNVGYAHIENFESIEGIADAKGELTASLGVDGIAILNADDLRVSNLAKQHPGRKITYGTVEGSDIRATGIQYSDEGSSFDVTGVHFETSLPGRHGVLNILAGIATATAFGIDPVLLVDAVRQLKPGKMRGERFDHHGIHIFNDSYNSNPDAARAMIDVLRDSPGGRKIAVLGEMLELGHWTEALHRDIGNYAASQGISVLIGIRGAARHTVDSALQAGMEGAAYFFDDPVEAGEFLRSFAQSGDVVLFKGSRGTRVEKALERFTA